MSRASIRQYLDDKAHRVSNTTPKAPGSPFAGSATTGITKSCIFCGKHRPQSQLTHWRGTFYRCTNKDECK